MGTWFIESKRHFLDYSEMAPEETGWRGVVLKKSYHALKFHTDAERIYQLSTMEGEPRFYCWIVPRGKDVAERGLKFLAGNDGCDEIDVTALVSKLHEAIKS